MLVNTEQAESLFARVGAAQQLALMTRVRARRLPCCCVPGLCPARGTCRPPAPPPSRCRRARMHMLLCGPARCHRNPRARPSHRAHDCRHGPGQCGAAAARAAAGRQRGSRRGAGRGRARGAARGVDPAWQRQRGRRRSAVAGTAGGCGRRSCLVAGAPGAAQLRAAGRVRARSSPGSAGRGPEGEALAAGGGEGDGGACQASADRGTRAPVGAPPCGAPPVTRPPPLHCPANGRCGPSS